MSSMAVFRFVSFSFASLLIAMASAITTSMFWSIIFFFKLRKLAMLKSNLFRKKISHRKMLVAFLLAAVWIEPFS